jgi:hypothetical protein
VTEESYRVSDLSRRAHSLRVNPLSANLRLQLLTILGMSVADGAVALVDPKPGPLLLAGVLPMTLSRNTLVPRAAATPRRDSRERTATRSRHANLSCLHRVAR